jgi:hypothetical protein
MLSIWIVPAERGIILKRASRREDLPLFSLDLVSYTQHDDKWTYLPVRPQMPIFSPGAIDNVTLSKAFDFASALDSISYTNILRR